MKLLQFNTHHVLAALAFAGIFLGTGSTASAFQRTRDYAKVTLSFDLLPTVGGSGTAAGTGSIEVVRSRGVSVTEGLDLTVTGLVDGTYSVAATLKSDPAAPPVVLGDVLVDSTVVVDPADPPVPPLPLPDGLDPFDIATLTVSDATAVVVLAAPATENIADWQFFANRPLNAPPADPLVPITPLARKKLEKIHGHVLIHARIVADVDVRRKFLLIGHGVPANTLLTINLDGVAVGARTSSKNGKVMVTKLDGDFRIAGVKELTLTDPDGTVVMSADFFPELD